MPTYDYQCFACQHRFELVQKISEDPVEECPECHAQEVKRLITATAFHLKGSGWYKTDYGSSGAAKSESTDSKSETATTASDSKTSSVESAAAKPEKKETSTSESSSKASD